MKQPAKIQAKRGVTDDILLLLMLLHAKLADTSLPTPPHPFRDICVATHPMWCW
jgi:hypothetical protein